MTSRVVYWHRDLPPLNAEMIGEHTVEATSGHVPGTLVHQSDLWDRCYEELMGHAGKRLEQEVARMGGTLAHVFAESIDTGHNNAIGDAWLHGCFRYMLYRQPDLAIEASSPIM
jgi:hypothetical protein